MAKDFKDLGKDLEEKVKKATRVTKSKPFLKGLGLSVLGRMRDRAKLGYKTAKKGAKRERFEPLSDGYKTWRKRNKSKLDGTTRPTKSNLTQTGDMLKDLIVKVSGKIVKFTGKNQAAKNKIKWNESKRNKERIFLRPSDKDLKYMSKVIKDVVRKILISK